LGCKQKNVPFYRDWDYIAQTQAKGHHLIQKTEKSDEIRICPARKESSQNPKKPKGKPKPSGMQQNYKSQKQPKLIEYL